MTHKNESDYHNIDMEKQHGDLDFGIVPGHIRGEWYENNGNKKDDVDPEQTRINDPDEMELAMMT